MARKFAPVREASPSLIAAITTRDNTTGALLGAGSCTLEINA